jgi:hypothetical protein
LVADGVVFSRVLVSAWRMGEVYTAIPPVGGSKAVAAVGADDGKTDVAKVQGDKVMKQGGGDDGNSSLAAAAVRGGGGHCPLEDELFNDTS